MDHSTNERRNHEKLTLISDVDLNQTIVEKQRLQNHVKQQQQKMIKFSTFYEEHGFGGLKKKQVLEYYMNEFLENIMRDRQKYQFLDCLKKKYMNKQKTSFDLQIAQILAQTEEQKQKRLQFYEHLRPIFIQLTLACNQFYRSYQKVISKLQRVHQEMKIQFESNLNRVKKKSIGAAWFQKNQYRKQMRRVRAQWIQLVKNQNEDFHQKPKSVKRKKIDKKNT